MRISGLASVPGTLPMWIEIGAGFAGSGVALMGSSAHTVEPSKSSAKVACHFMKNLPFALTVRSHRRVGVESDSLHPYLYPAFLDSFPSETGQKPRRNARSAPQEMRSFSILIGAGIGPSADLREAPFRSSQHDGPYPSCRKTSNLDEER